MARNFPGNKIKERGIKRFFLSFKYATEGIMYALVEEQNLIIMILGGVIALALSLILKITRVEFIIVLILIGIVIAFELINTSIEAVIDLIIEERNKYAKIAKDCAGGAVLVIDFIALMIGLIIFIPYIIGLFGG